ncbi:MAG: BTAD domain-containing putative transcriptional regulator [Gemmatimonadales bacterium]
MFRLRTLGGVSLERDGRPLGGRATQRRRLALLIYLATAGKRPVSRDKLITLLWPERDQERGRHSLSQMLWALRQELGDDAILAGIDEVRINPEVVGSDVGDLEAALSRGDWEGAVAGYAPFLDGFFISEAPGFERWVEEKRAALSSAVGAALESLADAAAKRADPLSAVGWWRQCVGLDPLDSRLALRFMESLATAGDRAAAIRHARVHAELLHQELNAPPDPAIEALARSFQQAANDADSLAVAPAPLRDPSAPVIAAAAPKQPALSLGRRRALLLLPALLVVCAAIALPRLHSPPSPAPVRLALLGSFEGSDSALALAVREAFRAELAGDQSIRMLHEFEIAEALRLMKLPPATRLTGTVAGDVAARRGAHYAITGIVAPLGSGVQLLVQVMNPASHAPVLTVSARPESPGEVIGEVGRLARALRARLGTLRGDTSARVLPAVTTSSLEALEQYALARLALSRGDRPTAITLGEGALVHDSLFTLAHYLVGDLLWFTDHQRHAEAHLERAQALAGLAPIREQFLVRARYQHLVADRPDSALTYYLQLRAAYPEEVLAYEGMAWTLRALGEHGAAAAAADTALKLGARALVPTLNNRLYALISVGDTATALAATRAHESEAPWTYREARYLTAVVRHDWAGALATLDRDFVDSTSSRSRQIPWLYRRHAPLLALGEVVEGRKVMEEIISLSPGSQHAPRALILQAIAEWEAGNGRLAIQLARRAKRWVDRADLSAAALARLYERLAILGAWLGDEPFIHSVRATIVRRDADRNRRSLVLALETVDGAAALVRGRAAEATGHLAAARRETFHGRSTSSLGILEADALARGGAPDRAGELYRAVRDFRIPEPDFEVWPVLSRIAAGRLAALKVPR